MPQKLTSRSVLVCHEANSISLESITQLARGDTGNGEEKRLLFDSQSMETNKMSVNRRMDEEKHSVYIQWNIIQPQSHQIFVFGVSI